MVLFALVSSSAHADELVDAARAAIQGNEFCQARDLYVALHRRDKEPKYLYNAAESAAAANDRVSALALYQQLLEAAPAFERAAKAKERVTELGQLIAASGSGTQCPPRAARCGDTYLDATEMCDDGNTDNGDGCDRNCTPTSCGNGIVTPPETCDDGNTADGDGCSSTCGGPSAPVAAAPKEPSDKTVPIVVAASGGALFVIGAVVAGIGGAGWLDLQTNKKAFNAASAAATASPDDEEKLQTVVTTRDKADASIASWNGVGQALWIGGVACGAVGLAAAAAGVSWLAIAE